MIIEENLTSIEELADRVRSAQDHLGDTLWFRGHAESDWELRPLVHRDYDRIGENNMFNAFRLRAPSRYANCPPHQRGDRWLPLMRHYGLPVRLLDWTESILIAAFFAVSYEQGKACLPAAIWATSPFRLNKHFQGDGTIMALDDKRRVRPLVTNLFSPNSECDKVLAVLTPEIDPRMMLQQSAFTIHALQTPLEDVDGAEKFLMKFIIPKEAKAQLAEDLKLLGIRLSALFPDLDHLSQEISGEHHR